jgi:hypothetical protein
VKKGNDGLEVINEGKRDEDEVKSVGGDGLVGCVRLR